MSLFPEILEIQFHNICNASCSICPYEEYSNGTTLKKMEPNLKEKILDDIYRNKDRVKRIIPYFNNEPFLDKNFISILKYFKEKMPSIEIEVSTNLSVFKYDDFKTIISEGLIDDLRISFFGGNKTSYEEMMPKLKFERSFRNLKSFLELRASVNPLFSYELIMVLVPSMDLEEEKAKLQKMFPEEKLNFRFFGYLDRAGSNSIKNNKKIDVETNVLFDGCSLKRNEERLCIDVNGNIPLCSQDWFLRENLGDLKSSTIEEIWNGKIKKRVDDIIAGEEVSAPNFICRDCKLVKFKDGEASSLNFSGDRYMSEEDSKLI